MHRRGGEEEEEEEGGRQGGRLQCYRTVERGIAESRDGGKREGEAEAAESERQGQNGTRGGEGRSEGKSTFRATWCVRGVGGDCPTKPYGQNYHTHTYVRPYRSEERGLI